MSTFLLGNIEITPIVEIDPFELPVSILFPDLDLNRLEPHRDWLEPAYFVESTVRLIVRSWLLKHAGTTVLVDACVGDHKHRPLRTDWHQRSGGEWLNRLRTCGVEPQDVDFVCCTHFHADHVGWNTQMVDGRWVPTFRNARTLASRVEFEHWNGLAAAAGDDDSPNLDVYRDSVLPVHEAGLLELVDDGFEVTRGLTLQHSPGHTPGHMSVDAASAGRRGVLCGDAIHSPLQMVLPDVCSAFCSDEAQAVRTRLGILEDLADSEDILVPAHFRGSGMCRVHSTAEAFRPEFLQF